MRRFYVGAGRGCNVGTELHKLSPMEIARHTVVSIDYTLTNEAGEVLDRSERGEPLDYIHGTGQIIPGLEAALAGRTIGDAFRVRILPADAYGERDPELVVSADLSQFGGGTPHVGMRVQADDEGAEILTVTAVEGEVVTLDGNHPLAGMPLTFEVTVVAVRSATAQELSHGHAHGRHGHDH
jgi:FKBP-type peptidyl-prolyl cis-trans isomerase SlyD